MKQRILLLIMTLVLLLPTAPSVFATETEAQTLPPPVFVAPGEEHLMHIKLTPDGIRYSVKEDDTVKIEGCQTTAIRLTIPSEIDGMTVNEIAVSAFHGYAGLMSIALPDSIEVIGASAFQKCDNLTAVVLPGGLTSIPDQCFADCRALQSVNLPSALVEIGEKAFYQCTMLGKLDVPAGLSVLGEETFYGCEQLILSCKENQFVSEYAEKHRIPRSFWETTNAQWLTIALGVAVTVAALIPIRRVIRSKRAGKKKDGD